MRPTGALRDRDPELELKLAITPESAEPYETTVAKFIPAAFVPGLQLGSVVDVMFLPESPGEVVFLMGPGGS
jgi:hypothetical protein